MTSSSFNNLRYVESMDSVRFNPNDLLNKPTHGGQAFNGVLEARETQLLFEILLSLLFGYRIVVPESYAIDSGGFFRSFDLIWKKIPKTEHQDSRAFFPFAFSFFEPTSYQTRSEYFRQRLINRLRNRDFALSGWGSLGNDMEAREGLAARLEKKEFDSAKGDFHIARDQISAVESIAEAMDQSPTAPVKAAPNGPSLRDYCDWLENIDSANLRGETKDAAVAMRQALADMQLEGSARGNRSVYRHRAEKAKDEDALKALIEYMDTCYNAVVSASIGPASEFFTTAGLDLSAASRGEILAWQSIGDLAEKSAGMKGRDDYRITGLHIASNAFDDAFRQLIVDAVDDVLDVWASRDWELSVGALHKAINANARDADDLRQNHIELLSRLKFLVFLRRLTA